jgi:hypothetical protein
VRKASEWVRPIGSAELAQLFNLGQYFKHISAGGPQPPFLQAFQMMKCIILLATTAIALPFVISILAPVKTAGSAVAERFLERSFLQTPTIPPDPRPEPLPVTADSLHAWVTSPDTAGYARAYAWRVMPLDFIYLATLGTFLALAATTLASGIAWPPAWGWIWLIFPLSYMLADVAEDCLIVTLMTRPASISQFTVDMLAVFRNVKIGANALAIAQIFVLGAAGAIWK